MEHSEISVIMSVYNTNEDYLRAAIESILKQTFINFEFLIVLDSPNDNSENIVMEYKEKDSRIFVIKNECNIGLTKSLNKALSLAKGKYIARMDADDYAVPDRLSIQYDYMERHPEVGVTGGHVYTGNKDIRSMTAWNHNDQITKINMLFHNAGVPHPTAMYRKEFCGEKVFYNECILKSQDFELWSRLIEKSKIVVLNRILLLYRIHPGQISAIPAGQYHFSRIIIAEQLKNKLGIDTTDDVETISSAYFNNGEISKQRIEKAFSTLVNANKEKKWVNYKFLSKVLHNIQVELEYIKYINEGRHKKEILVLMLHQYGVTKCLRFFVYYYLPKFRHDVLAKKYAKTNQNFIAGVLGDYNNVE